jgi:hypothetical protein
VFFAGGASGMSWALASVAAPAHCTASLGSIQNFGGYSRRCAGSHRDRVHCAGDRRLRSRPAGGRGDRASLSTRLPRRDPEPAYPVDPHQQLSGQSAVS